jgi:hypothetical protein
MQVMTIIGASLEQRSTLENGMLVSVLDRATDRRGRRFLASGQLLLEAGALEVGTSQIGQRVISELQRNNPDPTRIASLTNPEGFRRRCKPSRGSRSIIHPSTATLLANQIPVDVVSDRCRAISSW